MGYTDEELSYIFDKTRGHCCIAESSLLGRTMVRLESDELGRWIIADHSREAGLTTSETLLPLALNVTEVRMP